MKADYKIVDQYVGRSRFGAWDGTVLEWLVGYTVDDQIATSRTVFGWGAMAVGAWVIVYQPKHTSSFRVVAQAVEFSESDSRRIAQRGDKRWSLRKDFRTAQEAADHVAKYLSSAAKREAKKRAAAL